jgi:hypothetical protein
MKLRNSIFHLAHQNHMQYLHTYIYIYVYIYVCAWSSLLNIVLILQKNSSDLLTLVVSHFSNVASQMFLKNLSTTLWNISLSAKIKYTCFGKKSAVSHTQYCSFPNISRLADLLYSSKYSWLVKQINISSKLYINRGRRRTDRLINAGQNICVTVLAGWHIIG